MELEFLLLFLICVLQQIYIQSLEKCMIKLTDNQEVLRKSINDICNIIKER
jgi:hypothetical protein